MRNQRFGHCFLGNLLFFTHGISPSYSAHLFSFASRIYFNSCTPPADRLLFLHIKCFLLSQVLCDSCTPGAPRLPSCKRLRSKECPRCRTKWRYATAITKRVRGHRSLMFPMSPNGLIELFIQHYGFCTAFITLLMISLSVTSSSGVQVSHISFPSK